MNLHRKKVWRIWWTFLKESRILPETHSIEAKVLEVDLMFHSSHMNHIHMEDLQEEAPIVSVT